MLAGLVAAGQIYHDERLMASARKLGDFYVKSVGVLCTPERVEELRAAGTPGTGFAFYFPAIESLALLYGATQDERYLKAARAIAEFFRHFDQLPTDHSHGNLCAWRGILMLYEITREADYLKRAEAKWEAAVGGSFVWPIGGVGEHWHAFYQKDEGCSESDWLRFNLDLWRLTGRTRYLEMAGRLLVNQYAGNQTPNGGFGVRNYEGDEKGPIAMLTNREAPYCCSFHGPLGLHFLKAYLATGGKDTIRINLPFSFTAPVEAGGGKWLVTAATTQDPARLEWRTRIVIEPRGATRPVTLWMAAPAWARSVALIGVEDGKAVAAQVENGYVKLAANCSKKAEFTVVVQGAVAIEQRRFKSFKPEAGKLAVARDVTLLAGPEVLMVNTSSTSSRLNLLATVDEAGRLELLRDAKGRRVSPLLPGPEATEAQVHQALTSGRVVTLQPWVETQTRRRLLFAHDIVIVSADRLPADERLRFARRAADAVGAPNWGNGLEKRPDLWTAPSEWRFYSYALVTRGGGVGLLDGQGTKDYRFEFNMNLPKAGEGVTGWVVRARSASDCLMFQIQSSDTTYTASQWKIQPNTLRPLVCRGGKWTVLEPIKLKKKIIKGEIFHVATECRGDQVAVWIDEKKVYSGTDAGLHEGTVGFRANGIQEQGYFRNINLSKIE